MLSNVTQIIREKSCKPAPRNDAQGVVFTLVAESASSGVCSRMIEAGWKDVPVSLSADSPDGVGAADDAIADEYQPAA